MIDQLLQSLLSPKGKGRAKITRDTLILAALAYLVTQVAGIDKRLAVVESRLNYRSAVASALPENATSAPP